MKKIDQGTKKSQAPKDLSNKKHIFLFLHFQERKRARSGELDEYAMVVFFFCCL